MRFPQPFFRGSKDAWYLQLGKRQVSLGKDREEAFERYRVILLQERGENTEPAFRRLTAAQVFDLFLDWSSRDNEPRTYEWYRDFLQDFSDMYGALEAEKLKPFHVTRWLDSHRSWGEASRRCGTIAVKRAFNWADAEGILSPNPVKHVKKGPPKRRERILAASERQQILKAARGRAFREFVQALQETGCRPSEVGEVAAENVDLAAGLWILAEHKTKKKTGKPRLPYERSQRWIELAPSSRVMRWPSCARRRPSWPNRRSRRCKPSARKKPLPHCGRRPSHRIGCFALRQPRRWNKSGIKSERKGSEMSRAITAGSSLTLVAFLLAPGMSALPDDENYRYGGFSSHWTPQEWTYTASCTDIRN